MSEPATGTEPSEADESADPDEEGADPSGTQAVLGADVVDEHAVVGGPESGGYSSCEEALEEAVTSLERVTAERDEYLEVARRVQADFENFRKRVEGQRVEQVERAAEYLVGELLPVLDACEAAIAHGAEGVPPIFASLDTTLAKQGLTRVSEVDVAFDPTFHEAVLSEPGDPGDAPMVAEIMRPGYLWHGRVVRPAMVKVRG